MEKFFQETLNQITLCDSKPEFKYLHRLLLLVRSFALSKQVSLCNMLPDRELFHCQFFPLSHQLQTINTLNFRKRFLRQINYIDSDEDCFSYDGSEDLQGLEQVFKTVRGSNKRPHIPQHIPQPKPNRLEEDIYFNKAIGNKDVVSKQRGLTNLTGGQVISALAETWHRPKDQQEDVQVEPKKKVRAVKKRGIARGNFGFSGVSSLFGAAIIEENDEDFQKRIDAMNKLEQNRNCKPESPSQTRARTTSKDPFYKKKSQNKKVSGTAVKNQIREEGSIFVSEDTDPDPFIIEKEKESLSKIDRVFDRSEPFTRSSAKLHLEKFKEVNVSTFNFREEQLSDQQVNQSIEAHHHVKPSETGHPHQLSLKPQTPPTWKPCKTQGMVALNECPFPIDLCDQIELEVEESPSNSIKNIMSKASTQDLRDQKLKSMLFFLTRKTRNTFQELRNNVNQILGPQIEKDPNHVLTTKECKKMTELLDISLEQLKMLKKTQRDQYWS